MAGLTYLSTTTSSATFDRTGVSDIGLKCKLISKTGFCFDKGVTFAIFQDAGKPRSRNDPFNMSFTGLDKTSAFSLNIQVGRPLVGVLLKVLDAVIVETLNFQYTCPPRQILRFVEDLLVERVK